MVKKIWLFVIGFKFFILRLGLDIEGFRLICGIININELLRSL